MIGGFCIRDYPASFPGNGKLQIAGREDFAPGRGVLGEGEVAQQGAGWDVARDVCH